MKRPNILFIMADDHTAHAISAYGSQINRTPHLDRIANGGNQGGPENCPSISGREPEWELFDLEKDPREMNNVVNDPAYAAIRRQLTDQLHRLQAEYGDKPYVKDAL